MAKVKSFLKSEWTPGPPKKSRQGNGQHTKYAATSRNGAKKRPRGQGKG